MNCEECHFDYPQHLLSVFRTSRALVDGKLVCGICALKLSNRLHGVNRETLDGQQAERMRQAAIRWREKKSA